MKVNKTILYSLAVSAFLAIVLWQGIFPGLRSRPGKWGNGADPRRVPNFEFVDFRGERRNLADYSGRVILINFWASWCPPCSVEIPRVNELYRQYRDKGLTVIGVSLDRQRPDDMRYLIDELGIDFVNIPGDANFVEKFGGIPGVGPIPAIPTTVIIDRTGRVCKTFVGLVEKRAFEEAVRELL
jgi:cytochrome c biogenesis protein CcmG/thiol:disulfide interchange protein DsbE